MLLPKSVIFSVVRIIPYVKPRYVNGALRAAVLRPETNGITGKYAGKISVSR